jgi:hypothetical protein
MTDDTDPMVEFIQGRGLPVEMNSYRCVLNICNGLEGTQFEEIAGSLSINAGIRGGYLPRDSEDILPCLERYTVGARSWGLSKNDLHCVKRLTSLVSESKPGFVREVLSLLMSTNNEYLEHNLTIVVDMMIGDIDHNDENIDKVKDAISNMMVLISHPDDDGQANGSEEIDPVSSPHPKDTSEDSSECSSDDGEMEPIPDY